MTIHQKRTEKTLEIALEGRLDTTTAPELEAELKNSLGGVTELTIDFSKLEYISSAGLRVLLFAKKKLSGERAVRIINTNELVREVFDVTGFSSILNIES